MAETDTDPVAAYLSNIHSDLDGIGPRKTEKIRDVHAPCLLAAVEAVLALHKSDSGESAYNKQCGQDGFGWPCPTVRAVSAALLGEEATGPAVVCMHADQDGEGSHLLKPGETCPRKQKGTP